MCRETIGTNTSRVYLSFIGEQDSNDNSDDQYTVTGNTPFNNARITSSVLRLESLIKRETNETSKKHAQLIMLNIKQLIDPLVNEGSSLSESLRSNPNTHQTISVNSPAKAIKIEDCNQISTVQSNRYFLRSRKKFKPDCS